MHRFTVTIAAATALVAGAPIMGAGVGAAPMVAPATIRGAVDSLNVVERAQFIWLGHNYCWYDDGWNGPGWHDVTNVTMSDTAITVQETLEQIRDVIQKGS